MGHWRDLFVDFLKERFGEVPEAGSFQERFSWVSEGHARARTLLTPETLQSMPPEEVYACLKSLAVPACPIRLTNLGKVNEAAGVVEMLVKLLTVPGNFREKYRAAKIPQTGVVTITELLSVAKPMRFVLRNAMMTRALAKVVPLYQRRELEELSYEDFMDICSELAKVLQEYLTPAGLAEWAKEHRYLLLYAVLTAE